MKKFVRFNGYDADLTEEVSEEEAQEINENYEFPFPWAEEIEVKPGDDFHKAAKAAWQKRLNKTE